MKKYVRQLFAVLLSASVIASACSSQKGARFSTRPVPPRSSIAVIVDCPNNIQNIILGKFMEKGFAVKAINASDLLSPSDIYDISDFKKGNLAYPSENTLVSLEKSFGNIVKLHIYNYELNKAETLAEIRNKFDVQYLILLDLKDWQKVSWGRAIDLRTYEIVWIENYPARYSDNLDTIVNHLLDSISAR